jgi:predicted enzyme related to lactoylglutathione lyase
MSNPVVFFQFASPDPAATQAFLAELFEWEFGEGTPGVYAASIDPGGPGDFDVKGALLQLPEGGTPFISVFVRVGNLVRTFERAKELGAQVLVAPTRTATGVDVSIIRTPDGLVLGIVQA